MTTIGILSEGRTDQVVIKQVLLGYFAAQGEVLDSLSINPFFPPEVPLPGAPQEGGWTVLKQRLESGHHLQALGFNDYLVIHIDTDVCDHPGYDIPREGLDPDQLRDAAKARLIEWMGRDFYVAHGHQVLFAIAVDTIECWLLPLLEDKRAKQAKTVGCTRAVNEALKRAGRDSLEQNKLRRYADEAAPYRKRKTLLNKGPLSPSLRAFLTQLDEFDIQLRAG